VEDGDEGADAAQAIAVEFEEPLAFEVGDEVLFIGVAEGEEDL
jgi:hypothetical protein